MEIKELLADKSIHTAMHVIRDGAWTCVFMNSEFL